MRVICRLTITELIVGVPVVTLHVGTAASAFTTCFESAVYMKKATIRMLFTYNAHYQDVGYIQCTLSGCCLHTMYTDMDVHR